MWMWCTETSFSDELGSTELMVQLNNLRDLLQSRLFYDSEEGESAAGLCPSVTKRCCLHQQFAFSCKFSVYPGHEAAAAHV